MRVTLGVDYGDTHAASSLVQRLRFRDAAIDFTHVVANSLWAPPMGLGMIPAEAMISSEDITEVTRQEDQEAKKLIAESLADFTATEKEYNTTILRGNPTQTLMEHADSTRSDLLAVNASRENALMAMLTGSVARGLVIGAKQSVLLARHRTLSEGETRDRPVRAVLATDHSEYMSRCIEKFIGFMPLGLEHLTVLTAFPESRIKKLQSRIPHLAVDPGEAVRHELQNHNELLAKHLRDAFAISGTTVSTHISHEEIDQAILIAMQEADADLLIVGAQGHSLLQRLTIGSTSFRQAMTEPYSVMILRLDPAEIEAIRGSD
jgi:nucleotide-binding universal stress UspA family protein